MSGLLIFLTIGRGLLYAQTPTYLARTDYYYGVEYLLLGDFNNDGISDIVVLEGPQVFFGNGDGTFRQGPPNQTYGGNIGIAVADFNRDGNMRIKATLSGQGDMETFSYGLQRFIADLIDKGVDSLADVTIEAMPMRSGRPMVILTPDGKQMENMRVSLPATYRFARALEIDTRETNRPEPRPSPSLKT